MSFFKPAKRRVRFHLKTSETFEGLLVGTTRRDYILWGARLLKTEDESVSISGHVEIQREDVLFKQVLYE